MTPPRRSRRPGDASQHALSIPERPYRDTALLHGTLAALLCAIAVLTGRDVAKSAVVAAAYFTAATAWSWWRFSRRIRAARAAEAAAGGPTGADAEGDA